MNFEISNLIEKIKKLREEKNYEEADKLRQIIIDKGYYVWYYKDGSIHLFKRL